MTRKKLITSLIAICLLATLTLAQRPGGRHKNRRWICRR